MAGEERIVGAGQHVDDRIADADDVERGLAHGLALPRVDAAVHASAIRSSMVRSGGSV
jgi:hypothetical protein